MAYFHSGQLCSSPLGSQLTQHNCADMSRWMWYFIDNSLGGRWHLRREVVHSVTGYEKYLPGLPSWGPLPSLVGDDGSSASSIFVADMPYFSSIMRCICLQR